MKNVKSKEYLDLLNELEIVVNKLDSFNFNSFNSSEYDDNFINNLCVLVRDYTHSKFIK